MNSQEISRRDFIKAVGVTTALAGNSRHDD